MFCRNCGKELPDDTNFCNYCGARQDHGSAQNNPSGQSNGNPQPGYRAPQPNMAPQQGASSAKPKKSSRKALWLLAAIPVLVIAFIIGYFATGADKLKRPTAFDTPGSYTFDGLDEPSIADNGDGTFVTDNGTVVSEVHSAKRKVFVYESEDGIVSAKVEFLYWDYMDGMVSDVRNSLKISDVSLVDRATLEEFKSDAEYYQMYAAEMGSENVIVQITDTEWEYEMYFGFLKLDYTDIYGDPAVTELAADYLGVETKDGHIYMDDAEKVMLDAGYTLDSTE